MITPTPRTWPSPEDQKWGDRLLLKLVVTHTVPADVAGMVLDDALAACRESGQRAVDLFGDADTYADETARELVPATERAQRDLDGTLPGDRLSILLVASGAAGASLSAAVLVQDGW